MTLEELLFPIDKCVFFDEYFAQQSIHIARSSPDYFKQLFAVSDLEGFIENHYLQIPRVFLIKDGSPIDRKRYLTEEGNHKNTGEVSKKAIYELLEEGNTLVINGINHFNANLKELCELVEKELLIKTQCNLYTTFGQNTNGLDLHYDTHDIFVLQLFGSKHWHLYESKEQPLLPTRVLKKRLSNVENLSYKLTEKIHLQAGDVLYLPRGQAHQVFTADEPSMHIAFGILNKTWLDLFKKVVEQAEELSVFRQNLPHGFSSASAKETFLDDFKKECLQLLGNLSVSDLYNQHMQDKKQEIKRKSKGTLNRILMNMQLSVEDTVQKKEGLVAELQKDGFVIKLVFDGQQLNFPLPLESSLHFLMQDKPFKIDAIPGGINESLKLDTVKRLINKGFLEVIANKVVI